MKIRAWILAATIAAATGCLTTPSRFTSSSCSSACCGSRPCWSSLTACRQNATLRCPFGIRWPSSKRRGRSLGAARSVPARTRNPASVLGIPLTERRRSRTHRAVGYTTAQVLKTNRRCGSTACFMRDRAPARSSRVCASPTAEPSVLNSLHAVLGLAHRAHCRRVLAFVYRPVHQHGQPAFRWQLSRPGDPVKGEG